MAKAASLFIFNGNIKDITLPKGQRKVEQWFNTNAGFVRDNQQSLGWNLRTFPTRFNDIRADGYNNWDMALLRNFRIGEIFRLQLRAEAQDALNHAMFAGPKVNPYSTLFGTVNSINATEQRRINLGARLSW